MDVRLSQHIDKGTEDGLFISCVASCQNLWALVMDAGTGFKSQVYELSPFFLHKVHAGRLRTVYLLLVANIFSFGTITLFILLTGMDNGTMGKEFLHQCSRRSFRR